jgi:hypothetical protein
MGGGFGAPYNPWLGAGGGTGGGFGPGNAQYQAMWQASINAQQLAMQRAAQMQRNAMVDQQQAYEAQMRLNRTLSGMYGYGGVGF